MSDQVVTGSDVMDLLRQAVSERGKDYVYTDIEGKKAGEGGFCVNVDRKDDESPYVPMCIVGDVIVRAGVSPQWFVSTGSTGADAGTTTRRLAEHGELVLDHEARLLLDFAQRMQDGGKTWGETLALTENVHYAFHNVKERD